MPPATPQDAENASAESKLLTSALTLFSEKGYEGASIREIIQSAGVTRPVLYYYFENKEDLFTRLVEDKFSSFVGAIEELAQESKSCKERLKAIMCVAFDLAEHNMEAVRLILQVFFAPPQCGPNLNKAHLAPRRFKVIEELMRQGLEAGELSGGDARSLALVYMGIMDMHIMAKSDRPEMHLSESLGDGLVDLFLAGAEYHDPPRSHLMSPLLSPAEEEE